MGKKALIKVSLVEESGEKSNVELESEMLHALSKHPVIPWVAKIEEVKVTGE
jgi:hypothetical protein